MALGAASQAVTSALAQARLLGRAVPVTVNGVTLLAQPTGNLGGYGARGGTTNALAPQVQTVLPSSPVTTAGMQGLAGSPSGPAVAAPAQTSLLQRPSVITNQPVGANTGLFTPTNQPVGSTITAPQIPTINVTAQAPVQGTLNQANPNLAAGVQGAVGTPSGPSVAPTYNMPPAPDVATQAKNYRAQHGLSNADDAATDALNAESLAAARAGRTSFNPQLAAQYGQQQAAGAYGPQTNVVNALTAPQTGQGQPIMLAPTTASAVQPTAVGNNLLQQGLY